MNNQINEIYFIRTISITIFYFKFAISNDESRNNLAMNHSNKQFNTNDLNEFSNTQTPILSTYHHMHHDTASFTENDKLPWPYPYEHSDNTFKWKVIKPNKIHSNHPHNTLNILPNIETTSSSTIFSTDVNTYPSVIPPTSSYHPYGYETIYVTRNVNTFSENTNFENPSERPDAINYIENPIENQNDSEILHAKDGHIQHYNHEYYLIEYL